jgi:putative transposase
MGRTSLSANMLLEYRGEDEKSAISRILWIDSEGNRIVTIDIARQNKHALPIWQTRDEVEEALEKGDAHIIDTDPYAVLLRPEDTIPEEHSERRERAWKVIEDLVTKHGVQLLDPRTRGPLIAALSEKEEPGKKKVRKGYVYDALRRYWQGGQTKNALLPFFHESGAKGKEREGKERKLGRPSALARKGETPAGVIMTKEMRSKLLRGYKKYYVSGKEKTLEKALQRTREDFFNSGFDEAEAIDAAGNKKKIWIPRLPEASLLPTPDQFRYVHEKYQDLTQLLTSREGERRFALRHRAILGESTHMAAGPGFLYQGDATIGDIHLVSSRDRSRLIGRPIIYVIIDVFTRLIAGFSVSLEGPSWVGMMLALENATADKVAFCREYGIDITSDQWPSYGLPQEILGDRGELEGYNPTNLINALGVRVSNTPPYRCDWKAIVEQNFRLISDEIIHWKPGAVYKKRERGDKDYRHEACLTLQEFRQLMILCALKHNNYHRMDWYKMDDDMVSDHVEQYPIDLWNWGVCNRVGHPQTKPAEIIKLNLLPPAVASVTERGISFDGVYYTCALAEREQWYVRARHQGRWPVSIAYDPRKLEIIYLSLDSGRRIEPCELIEREQPYYQGREWFEIHDYAELKMQAEEASRTRHYRVEAEFNAKMDAVIETAVDQTQQALDGPSSPARWKNSRETRRGERDDERAKEAWNDLGVTKVATVEPVDQPEETKSIYVPPDQSLDEMRKLRQKKWGTTQEKGEKTNEESSVVPMSPA